MPMRPGCPEPSYRASLRWLSAIHSTNSYGAPTTCIRIAWGPGDTAENKPDDVLFFFFFLVESLFTGEVDIKQMDLEYHTVLYVIRIRKENEAEERRLAKGLF